MFSSLLIDAWYNLMRHFSLVLFPQFAILLKTSFVIIELSRHKQKNVIKRIEPWPYEVIMPNSRSDAQSHTYLAEVVDMSADSPKS